MRITNTDLECLERFDAFVVYRRIYGPYRYDDRDGYRRTARYCRAAQSEDALELLEQLWPWLSNRRKARALELVPLEAILMRSLAERES